MPIRTRFFCLTLALATMGTSALAQPAKRATGRPATKAAPPKPKAAPTFTALDFVQISAAPSPRVSYAMRREANSFRVALEVKTAPTEAVPSVGLGVAAAKSLALTNTDAKIARVPGAVRYEFAIPFTRLVGGATDWTKLRLGVAVAWKGGALGLDRERERFRHIGGATHGGLSTDSNDWLPLNLNEYASTVSDRKNNLVLNFVQPANGKATIVIEDGSGKRVRNLIAGEAETKGNKRIEWDGLDDDGVVVAPGNYRWRAITHNGIKPKFQFSFLNATGSNHGTYHTATSNGKYTFLGTSVSEGGVDAAAYDNNGETKHGYHTPLGMGLDRAALAADDKYLYIARDGISWGQAQPDTNKPDWKNSHTLSLIRMDIEGEQPTDFPGGRFVPISSQEWGPGSADKREFKKLNLAGMALCKGKLYIGSTVEGALIVVDPATGTKTGAIKVPDLIAVTSTTDALYAISGQSIIKVNPNSGEVQTLAADAGANLQGIAVDAKGQIFVTDGQSHTVHVFDANGKKLRDFGTPGGNYKGKYDSNRLINPRGLAFGPDGKLWITEERWTPKRYAFWNADIGKATREYFGPTAYGAPGAGFDPLDHQRWVGQGALWNVDFATKKARPTSLLGTAANVTNWHFTRYQNRTFLIGFGQATFVCELMPDGSVKDRAMISGTHTYAFSTNWTPPKVFIDAYNMAYPKMPFKSGDIMPKGGGVMWVDTDGDGEMQANELQFATSAEDFAGAYWGQTYDDLNLRLPAIVKGKRVLVSLPVQGLLPGGAPKYGDLNAAIKAAPQLQTTLNTGVESTTDSRNNIVFNTDPKMTAFSSAGKLLWTYPNNWSGVHGSHNAPLPQVGQLQGTLFFLGMAPLDQTSDVFMMNGNHGRYFAITSDGFYLDEMFKDVRLGGANDVYMVGGESFGGVFEKSNKNGKYYLQAGGIEYRNFEIDGLDSVKRSSGLFNVSPAQASAAESRLKRKMAVTSQPKEATARYVATPPNIDGNEADWPVGDAAVQWNKNNQFPVTTRVTYDQNNLYLHYTVQDDSPWLNTGKDWQLLFKTGDSVDLQLGTDPTINPSRTGPVPGDLRLLIAPYKEGNIAVLYRHRLAGTTKPVAFTSPWRGENVDVVKRLDSAKIAVVKEGGRYRVEAAIPLSELNLKPQMSATYKADFGVIYGDTAGTINLLRNYWSNQATGLVNDVPGEIMLSPDMWGALRFEDRP